MAKKVYLVHGWSGSPEANWFPWLKSELEKKGFEVYVPAMPNTDNPKVNEWISHITKLVKNPDKDTYFIGHSLGCITIARYLQFLPETNKIGGCLFVAGFSGGINIPEIAQFYQVPLNVNKIKEHTNNLITIFSDNDDVVPLKKGIDFQESLGAKLVIEKNAGHFDGGKYEIILNEFVEMAK